MKIKEKYMVKAIELENDIRMRTKSIIGWGICRSF